jgi:hypothetical protein
MAGRADLEIKQDGRSDQTGLCALLQCHTCECQRHAAVYAAARPVTRSAAGNCDKCMR